MQRAQTTQDRENPDTLIILPSGLGWMALRMSGEILNRLAFGHTSAGAAAAAVDAQQEPAARLSRAQRLLVERLQAYAEGRVDDFCDVNVDPGPVSGFRANVISRCRKIPYGTTATYGDLAAAAGSPGAARAVGRCMATNRIPLVIPCHRVVPASGGPGPFTAPGGTEMKRRLLAMEARHFLA